MTHDQGIARVADVQPHTRCVNAHDRCYGGAGGPCPCCEVVCFRDQRGRFASATLTRGSTDD